MSTSPLLGSTPSDRPFLGGEPVATREIVDIDLHFLRKVRGLQAISRYGMQDDGSCLVSVADAMETRVSHIVRASAEVTAPPLTTYSVETLRKLEIGVAFDTDDAPRYLGMSDDALYGFHGSRKSRFLSDRRAAFADVSLATSGQRFAVLFSDMLASGWAVALGSLSQGSGRLLWTKDISFTATRVALDRTGRWTVVGGDAGDIYLLGSERELAARWAQNIHVTALATLGPAGTVFAGLSLLTDGDGEKNGETASVVGCLEADGGRRWQTRLLGTPIEVGCDATGQVTAVLLRQDDKQGKLIVLGEQGLPAAEVEVGNAPTGLSVAPSGQYIAVSLRDGTLAVYAPRFGSRMAEADGTDVLDRAHELARRGAFADAVAGLHARLDVSPADVEAFDALTTILSQWRTETLRIADEDAVAKRWAEADRHLERFLNRLPASWHDDVIAQARRDLRARWAEAERAQGQDALLAGDAEEAERCLQNAIVAQPQHRDARGLLAAAQTATRIGLERDGQACLRRGDFARAAHLLRLARQKGANRPEIAQLLREAQVGEALVEGNRLYQERQYEAAAFHFKKVLRLAPDHAEARQRLGYAESMSQPSSTSDRFRRLE